MASLGSHRLLCAFLAHTQRSFRSERGQHVGRPVERLKQHDKRTQVSRLEVWEVRQVRWTLLRTLHSSSPPDASRLRFKLAQENDDTAEVYDEKWAAYTAETVAFSLSQLPQLPEGARVLDLACGTGAMLRALASPDSRQPPLGEYVGLDNSAAMLRRAEAACSGPACAAAVPRRWLHCPADAPLPLPDAHFDAVVTANSFHFFGDRETSLREAARVLKPGGTLLVADWCADYLSCQLLELYLRLVGRPTAPVLRAAQLRGLVEGVGSLEVVEESDKLVRAWWGFMCLRARKRG